MRKVAREGGIGAEPEEIGDFENPDRVDNKECDEPSLLTGARGVPEGITLQNNSPESDHDDQGQNGEHKSRGER